MKKRSSIMNVHQFEEGPKIKCPKCGKELPDLVPLGEFSCCDGVPDICPFCHCDLWCYEEKKPE